MDVHLPWPEGAPPYFGPWKTDEEIYKQVIEPAFKKFNPASGEALRNVGIGRNKHLKPVVVAHLTFNRRDWLVSEVNLAFKEISPVLEIHGQVTWLESAKGFLLEVSQGPWGEMAPVCFPLSLKELRALQYLSTRTMPSTLLASFLRDILDDQTSKSAVGDALRDPP